MTAQTIRTPTAGIEPDTSIDSKHLTNTQSMRFCHKPSQHKRLNLKVPSPLFVRLCTGPDAHRSSRGTPLHIASLMSPVSPLSLENLLNTVDSLVRTVANKNLELEELKKNYDERLHLINRYIELVQNAAKEEEDKAASDGRRSELISQEQFLGLVNQKVECSDCRKTFWDNSELLEYVLIPKKTLKYLLKGSEDPLSDAFGKLRTAPVYSGTVAGSGQRRKEQPKGKKTCSYCHKTGHSRAKCFARLNNPVAGQVLASNPPSTQ